MNELKNIDNEGKKKKKTETKEMPYKNKRI